jgi:NAD(P)-dependent dehydrogenase (short-subunit alcohol dehydrogenase family)
MDTATLASHARRQPELLGQTVVVIGGSAGIGLETARRARAEGADVILTARNPERLQGAASELGALRTAAFDANDPASLERFFLDLPTPIDHVMVTGPGPRYWPLMEMEFEQARLAISEHILLALWVARNAASKVRPGGTLLFMGGTGARRPARGLGARIGCHCCNARVCRRPRPRPRAGPGQSHRRGFHRHAVIGSAPRR